LAQIIKSRIKHKRNQSPQEFVVNNFALDRKIKEAVFDLKPSTQWSLMELSDEDKELIADFIADFFNQYGTAMAPNTKKIYVDALYHLSKYVMEYRNRGVYKPFREMTHDDFFADQHLPSYGYLRSLKKTFEQDPKEKWVNTYNTEAARYSVFWKWLTQPDLRREERQESPQLKGYRPINHKSNDNKERVSFNQFWSDEEHRVFLKYCEDSRLKCFHAMHRDVGGRPSELLALKIGDVKFKALPNGKKCAEFRIGGQIHGKMKKERAATIIDAIPYFNFWRAVHPRRDNPENAYLFPSYSNKAKNRNIPLAAEDLYSLYVRTIEQKLVRKLEQPDTPLRDKVALKSLIYDKPHNPYLRRHEWGTENFRQVNLDSFKKLIGHSKNSRTWEKYVHSQDTDGVTDLQIAKGLMTREETYSQAKLELQRKDCPYCKEVNAYDADFCFSCNLALSKKAWEEATAENEASAQKAAEETENMKKQLEVLKAERERDNNAIAERVELRLKEFVQSIEESIELKLEAKHNRIAHESLSQNKQRLNKIKNEKQREALENQLLEDATTAAEIELEEELEDEAAEQRLAATQTRRKGVERIA